MLGAGLSVLVLAGCRTAPADPSADAARELRLGEAEPSGPAPAAGRWTRLPDSPLSPREAPAAAHVPTRTGDLAVFVGGYTGRPCPPTHDCAFAQGAYASDGAAYHLDSGTWQPVADAPRPVAAYSSTAVLDATLYVLTSDHLLAWDSTQDSWTELEPPRRPRGATLVADRHATRPRLLLASGGDENGVRPDQAYDPAAGTWSQLPADPLQPSFDRVLVSTPSGLVLVAKPLGADGGPEDPALVRGAVLPDGARTWQPLPSGGDQLGGWSWAWTGRRLVDPTPGGADGGKVNNFGRTIPYGGALDPVTGDWSPLAGTPAAYTGGWGVEALGGRHHAVQGWVYDDGDGGRSSDWTRLVRPVGAPPEPGRGVWVHDVLVVSGGADWDGLDDPDDWTARNVWSSGAWAYRPE
ncbi:Kelch repeat-containing protein [Nocardioides campestrisoli]|uniref:hypothetical protein n=1 Tax=Nocardioides campestrisoli TaxID=2736757 RepID=UPI0015E71EF6|nr:hypothetical protein [Nocardioides campestrisoli]